LRKIKVVVVAAAADGPPKIIDVSILFVLLSCDQILHVAIAPPLFHPNL
jgi:hypothetical protein